jgi:transcription elongation GreA/GreB family factor
MLSKNVLLERLRARIAADLAALTESQRSIQAGATHEETRAEDDKDTRAVESSYLARGLAERVSNLRHAVAVLASFKPGRFGVEDAVAMGALVELSSNAGGARYFVVPAAGGLEIDIDGARITSVTPTAPLGAALIGRFIDEDVDVLTPKGVRSFTVVAID